MYRIGDFARLAHVSVKTLRHYDAIGLLRPASVDPQTGYRSYRAEQAADLLQVQALKGLGLSLEEIAMVLAFGADQDRVREVLVALRTAADRELADARARVMRIDASLARLDRGDPTPFPVATKRVPARTVASIREGLSTYDEISRLFDEIERHVVRHRGRSTRGALFYGCDSDTLDCEAVGFLGRTRIPSSGRVRVRELPPVEVAAVVHTGPLEESPAAFEALDAWVRENGVRRDGPFVEIYYGGGSSGHSVVEIQFPVRHAAKEEVWRRRRARRAGAAESAIPSR